MGMRVIAVDGGEEKGKLCKELGAEEYVDFTQVKDIPARVVEITTYGSHGCIVFAAAKEGYEMCYQVLRPGGTAVAVGLPTSTDVLAGAPPLVLALRRINIVGSVTGTIKVGVGLFRHDRGTDISLQDIQECLDFTARGIVHPILTKVSI